MSHKKQSSFSEIPPSPTASEGPTVILQEPVGRELVVMFQCGLEKEAFVFEAKDLAAVKEQACVFLETKVRCCCVQVLTTLRLQVSLLVTNHNCICVKLNFWWRFASKLAINVCFVRDFLKLHYCCRVLTDGMPRNRSSI